MSSINSPVLVAERRTGLRRIPQRIVWQRDGTWLLTDTAGRDHPATLLPSTWLTSWIMHLRWRLESGRTVRAIFWRWQMPAAEWQRWRQRLWLQGLQVPDSGTA